MNTVSEQEIEIFRKSMSTFRKVAGWSAADLGRMVKVTKQTILNLENKPNSMTAMQYYALRSIFEREAVLKRENKDNPDRTLEKVMIALLKTDNIDEIEKKTEQVRTVTASRKGGATSKQIVDIMEIVFPIITGISIIVGAFMDPHLDK